MMIIQTKEDMIRFQRGERYEWNRNAGFDFHEKADVEVIANHLERMAEAAGGILSTEEIAAEGDNPSSPLYPVFEHDLELAAQKYRLIEARNLVGSIIIVKAVESDEPDGEPLELRVRAYQNVTQDGRRGYMHTHLVTTREELQAQVVASLRREILAWTRRAKDFEEFTAIVAVVEQFS